MVAYQRRSNPLWSLAFAASFLALGGADFASGAEPAKESKDYWRAWSITKGDDTKLVLEGIYANGGPGTVVVISEAVPQGPNPKILLLNLKTWQLPGAWPDVIRPIPAHFEKSPYKAGTYESLQIIGPGNQSVEVKPITDAGSGPDGR